MKAILVYLVAICFLPTIAPSQQITTTQYVNLIRESLITRPLKILPSLEQFAKDIFENVVANYSGNVMLSPVAIQTSLALMRMAAESQTAKILNKALYLSNMTISSIGKQFQSILQPIQNNPIIYYANALFIDPKYEINPLFQVIANDLFYSSVYNTIFTDGFVSANAINNWVSGATGANINDIVSPEYMENVRNTTTMIVANAVSFNGRWAHQFDKSATTNSTFYTGECIDVNGEAMQMMETIQYFKFGIFPQLNARVLEMPYTYGNMTMYVLLPDDCNGVVQLQEKINKFNFADFNKIGTHRVHVRLPKFRIVFATFLKHALSRMGLGNIFSFSSNFNGLIKCSACNSDTSSLSSVAPLTIMEMIHKANIDFNEDGTVIKTSDLPTKNPELLNAPAVGAPTEDYEEFNANHAFIFLITTPAEMIFMGKFVG